MIFPRFSPLDESFPLGDGVAETWAEVMCPYCGADVEVVVDPGGGAVQQYVEDCEVCCQSWLLTVRWDHRGSAHAHAVREDET